MRALFVAIVALLSVCAVARDPKTGCLTGHVDIGPLRGGPERPGQDKTVPPEVYRRYSVVISQHGPQKGQAKSHLLRLVAKIKLTDKGDFKATLAPGDYQVTVEPVAKIGSVETKEVSIKAGQTVKVTIHVDTGLR